MTMPAYTAEVSVRSSRPSWRNRFGSVLTLLHILRHAFLEARAMRAAAYRRYPFMDW